MIVSLHKNFVLLQLLLIWNVLAPVTVPYGISTRLTLSLYSIWDYDWGMHNTFGNDCGVNILRECNTKLKGLRKLPLVKVHRYKIRVESAFLDL